MCLNILACTPVVEDDYTDSDLFTDSLAVPVSNLIETENEPVIYSTGSRIETKNASPIALVEFAKTLVGIPYKYASTNPKEGFDCSGFITYVFNHFDIAVPRSSKDFTFVGKDVSRTESRPGDLILFTGTNPNIKTVGHMGIVTFNSPDTLLFIHSTSGKLNSVTVTPLNDYYQSRFVKVIRVFPQNNKPAPNP